MTILETDVVDILATRPDDRVVLLVISDHLDWSRVDEHLALIARKVTRYVAFIEAGELEGRVGPEIPRPLEPVIRLTVAFAPPPATDLFVADLRRVLAGKGIGFEIHRGAGTVEP